jgi:hypothetical protein
MANAPDLGSGDWGFDFLHGYLGAWLNGLRQTAATRLYVGSIPSAPSWKSGPNW